jgi:hypothetical protein
MKSGALSSHMGVNMINTKMFQVRVTALNLSHRARQSQGWEH